MVVACIFYNSGAKSEYMFVFEINVLNLYSILGWRGGHHPGSSRKTTVGLALKLI